jgi:endonuclease III
MEFDDSMPCAIQRACIARGDWHVLVGCLLLNMTTRTQVRSVLPRLFEIVPGPESLAGLSDEQMQEVVDLLTPLGLVNRRVWALCNMTEDYLAGKPPEEIRHVGQYALDSYELFVRGNEVEKPTDHELGRWVEFQREKASA